jgi:hypothetical protein
MILRTPTAIEIEQIANAVISILEHQKRATGDFK